MATNANAAYTVSYSGRKKDLKDVKLAMARRLMWADDRYNPQTTLSQNLTTACDAAMKVELKELSNRSTFAVGVLGKTLLLAAQGFTMDSDLSLPLKKRMATVMGVNESDINLVMLDLVKLGLSSQCTGLHAEMMIVRYCVKKLDVGKKMLGAQLTVGCSLDVKKGCCPNCAGWMNAYNIPHTETRENLSDKWRHPITLALYESKHVIDNLYQKIDYTSANIAISKANGVQLIKEKASSGHSKEFPDHISQKILDGLQITMNPEDYTDV